MSALRKAERLQFTDLEAWWQQQDPDSPETWDCGF